ncbi:hypothetical protein [Piscinibacter sp.]|uniref:hypothetical protein n=1 Tax=Piscinibacter sp. TaxID=1903157 RepID=UPI002BD6689A|nr:hypothetical protein [Albitalea sp.]HUG22645.1 hypothetical protein [Albitalea sp.]
MPDRADLLWFKEQFQARIERALRGTPLGVDLIAAIACQETGHVWSALRRKGLAVDEISRLCVGDTLDADKGRRAFPRTKADLIAHPGGPQMFDIARHALLDMAQHIRGFAGAAARPHKFCHGFGLFQRDLQFFVGDPQYFLQRRYERFDDTLAQCLDELKRALRKLGLERRASLTDLESAALGIAYNTGGFKPRKGLKQGHFDGTKFYGEALFDFIRLSQTVALPGEAAPLAEPPPGEAILPPPTALTATGPFLRVDTRVGTLRLRREPTISTPVDANVVGQMPDGHPVRAVTGAPVRGFLEVETSLAGALLRGFASTRFLQRDRGALDIPVVVPLPAAPAGGVVAVTMPRRPGTVTRRRGMATAHSLNEPGQPLRHGSTVDELRAELAQIIHWLAVDKATHARYLPREGLTFCNIYCHDFCHLAGAYLPRVWWTAPAIVALSQGRAVEPLIGNTIVEMRANDLFRWLRDFGPLFGWRQTGTLTKLQLAANQGAIGLIVARRKHDGRSGHVVAVVPETLTELARRDAAGEVVSPLQSQAGTSNFRYGTGRRDWWRGEQFAESAFWVHA